MAEIAEAIIDELFEEAQKTLASCVRQKNISDEQLTTQNVKFTGA